jgi:hypothetical protein
MKLQQAAQPDLFFPPQQGPKTRPITGTLIRHWWLNLLETANLHQPLFSS